MWWLNDVTDFESCSENIISKPTVQQGTREKSSYQPETNRKLFLALSRHSHEALKFHQSERYLQTRPKKSREAICSRIKMLIYAFASDKTIDERRIV